MLKNEWKRFVSVVVVVFWLQSNKTKKFRKIDIFPPYLLIINLSLFKTYIAKKGTHNK